MAKFEFQEHQTNLENRVVDLAQNQAAKPWKPIFRTLEMYRGQICNLGKGLKENLPTIHWWNFFPPFIFRGKDF